MLFVQPHAHSANTEARNTLVDLSLRLKPGSVFQIDRWSQASERRCPEERICHAKRKGQMNPWVMVNFWENESQILPNIDILNRPK